MNGLNRELDDMLNSKKLSSMKVRNLIMIKKIIDRVANKDYIPHHEVNKIEKKFGFKPDIITWGDYFQTQVASDHWQKSDLEFQIVADTVLFDVIAATMIFNNKNKKFFETVKTNSILSQEKSKLSLEDEENIHLEILMNYHQEMNLDINSLQDDDFNFFEQFAIKSKVS